MFWITCGLQECSALTHHHPEALKLLVLRVEGASEQERSDGMADNMLLWLFLRTLPGPSLRSSHIHSSELNTMQDEARFQPGPFPEFNPAGFSLLDMS